MLVFEKLWNHYCLSWVWYDFKHKFDNCFYLKWNYLFRFFQNWCQSFNKKLQSYDTKIHQQNIIHCNIRSYDYLIYFILLSVRLYLYICVVAIVWMYLLHTVSYISHLQLQILVELHRDAEYNCTSLLVFIIYSQRKVSYFSYFLLLFFRSAEKKKYNNSINKKKKLLTKNSTLSFSFYFSFLLFTLRLSTVMKSKYAAMQLNNNSKYLLNVYCT